MSKDEINDDVEDGQTEGEDLDFDGEELDTEVHYEDSSSAPMDVYTALLLVSFGCYVTALVYTLLELKPYCTEWMGGMF